MKNEDLILEYLKKMDSDAKEFKAEVYRRFEQMERRLERIEDNQVSEKKRLDDVYEARNQVTVNFSRAFATMNILISGVIAALVALFVGK